MRKFKGEFWGQFDFGGPVYNEKDQELYLLACIDRFSKFPSAEVFDRANADKILNFLQEYVLLHGVPCSIRLYQAQFRYKTCIYSI